MTNPQHRLEVFDSSLQKTYLLLDDICRDLQWEGLPQQAYGALRAVLHTLRDRLTVEEAVHLGAQLPMIVRGFYYDGWKPAHVPKKMHKEEFLKEVLDTFQFYWAASPAQIVEVVLKNLARHIDPAEMEHLKKLLPKDVRELIPEP